jgi:hypothetical protein
MPEQHWSDNLNNRMAERPPPSPPPRDYSRRRPISWSDVVKPNLRPQPIQLEPIVPRQARNRTQRQENRQIPDIAQIEALLVEVRDILNSVETTTQQVQRLMRTNFSNARAPPVLRQMRSQPTGSDASN